MDYFKHVFHAHSQTMNRQFYIPGMAQLPLIDDHDQILKILKIAENFIKSEPNIIEIDNPVIIIGNLNGSIFHLYRLLMENGLPPYKDYLFLGNTIGSNDFSFECILFILVMKIIYPDNIHIVRGTNEINENRFTLKFFENLPSQDLRANFYNLFKVLPLAARVYTSFFCINHSIPLDLNELDEIDRSKIEKGDQISKEIFGSESLDCLNSEEYLDDLFNEYGIRMIIKSDNFVEGGVITLLDGRVNVFYSGCNLHDISCALLINDSDSLDALDIEKIPIIKRHDVEFLEINGTPVQKKIIVLNTMKQITNPIGKSSICILGDKTAISMNHPIHSKMRSFERIKKIYRYNTANNPESAQTTKGAPSPIKQTMHGATPQNINVSTASSSPGQIKGQIAGQTMSNNQILFNDQNEELNDNTPLKTYNSQSAIKAMKFWLCKSKTQARIKS
ncbi:hypothetical protein TRFO_11403 [Tritrichomonas foetus]|uniref:protein-serine/threonine phosphatase n=1 Tax=Tritrichomonas foetus TaxID=1144522 RepID=A0A1J4JA36_9EUKA|nr:hypothetical protein TRFO_11403 [Tritrichomonas foetus]|eukprot:OHS94116.1 hypothetical protein TRFO_11403 [Tritrichomonas foetus]